MSIKRDFRTRLLFMVSLAILCGGGLLMAGLLAVHVRSLREHRRFAEAAKAEAERLAQTLQDLEAEHAALEKEKSRLDAELQDVTSERDEMRVELAAARDEMRKQKQRLSALEAEIEELKRELKSAEEEQSPIEDGE